MNHFFLNIIFLFLTHFLVGQQNLVPNGSFEEYSECPDSRDSNNGIFERATGWYSPTSTSPDFIHKCSNSIGTAAASEVNVPLNFSGYQQPFHGDGYALIYGAAWINNGNVFDGSEYIQCELAQTLNPCHRYKFSMRVSLSNKSNVAINNLGVYFSNGFTEPTTNFLDVEPQILFSDYYTDTSNWLLLEGSFIAKTFQTHITLGCFAKEEDSIYLYSTTLDSLGWLGSSFYIDSISLIELNQISDELCIEGELNFPNILTPNNDSSNDILDATNYFSITDEIIILNRWGNVITILTKENPIWDGRAKNGKPCTEGAYFYTFEYQWGAQTKQKSGFIHLVR